MTRRYCDVTDIAVWSAVVHCSNLDRCEKMILAWPLKTQSQTAMEHLYITSHTCIQCVFIRCKTWLEALKQPRVRVKCMESPNCGLRLSTAQWLETYMVVDLILSRDKPLYLNTRALSLSHIHMLFLAFFFTIFVSHRSTFMLAIEEGEYICTYAICSKVWGGAGFSQTGVQQNSK